MNVKLSSTPEKHRHTLSPLENGALPRAAAELLVRVPERTRHMLHARFGVDGKAEQTLAEIGSREHISRERVRQIIESGLSVLRKPESAGGFTSKVRLWLLELARLSGGVLTEERTLQQAGAPQGDQGALRLMLSSMPEFTEARETQRTLAHWELVIKDLPAGTPALEHVLEVAERLLKQSGQTQPIESFHTALRRELNELTDLVAEVYLSVSQHVVRTPLGTYGLRAWRTAVPRSVGDKAHVVLSTHGKPLHFREVAEEINRIRFDQKRAIPETVHNDLIRDHRFVLVGRGLYALREWGFSPGRVADVIERVLQNAGRPLKKAEILAAVAKERFVKRNTILLSLAHHAHVRLLPDGTYALTLQTQPTPVRAAEGKPPESGG